MTVSFCFMVACWLYVYVGLMMVYVLGSERQGLLDSGGIRRHFHYSIASLVTTCIVRPGR